MLTRASGLATSPIESARHCSPRLPVYKEGDGPDVLRATRCVKFNS
jgi:hypothetical protein